MNLQKDLQESVSNSNYFSKWIYIVEMNEKLFKKKNATRHGWFNRFGKKKTLWIEKIQNFKTNLLLFRYNVDNY